MKLTYIIKNIIGVTAITTIATTLFVKYVKHYEKKHGKPC